MAIRKRTLRSGAVRYDVRIDLAAGGQISRTFETKKAAERWERSYRAGLDRGEQVDLRAAASMTVAELADEYLRRPGVSPRTLAQHRSTLNRHVLPVLGRVRVAKVTRLDVQRLVSAWATTAASSTVHRRFAVIRTMFGLAVDLQVITTSPCVKVRLPTLRRTVRQLPTLDEVRQVAAAMPQRTRAMPMLAALTGLRWGEVAGLRVRSADLLRRTLTVDLAVGEIAGGATVGPPKRGSVRTFRISRAVVDEIAAHMARNGLTAADPDAWLFTSPSGGPLRYSGWWEEWKAARIAAGLPDLGFHDLRRLNATLLVAAGVDPKTAQHRLGHADISMTLAIYAQATEQGDSDAADRLDELAGRPSAINLPSTATE
ncbi:MAG: tyrosine-type recombinase/integrase [Acidimicrobiia bacterium]